MTLWAMVFLFAFLFAFPSRLGGYPSPRLRAPA